jgi:hypothetical protein
VERSVGRSRVFDIRFIETLTSFMVLVVEDERQWMTLSSACPCTGSCGRGWDGRDWWIR